MVIQVVMKWMMFGLEIRHQRREQSCWERATLSRLQSCRRRLRLSEGWSGTRRLTVAWKGRRTLRGARKPGRKLSRPEDSWAPSESPVMKRVLT